MFRITLDGDLRAALREAADTAGAEAASAVTAAARRLTPVEVEARFNRDLRYVPPRAGRNALLVMDELVAARSGHGVRAATPRRLAQGRSAASIVLFILVPQVTLTKRLDVAAVLAAVAADYPDLTIRSPG